MIKQLLFITIIVAALAVGDAWRKPRRQRRKVYEAEMAIVNLIRNKTINGNDMPFIAGFVRLIFHDCVGLGGCDGCINHNHPANGGLKKYTDELDALYGAFDYKMSRADFYAFAAVVALGMSTAATKDKFTGRYRFRFGRKSCKTSPIENDKNEKFANPHHGLDKTLAFFKIFFRFSRYETVALLGVHTLGRTRIDDSGFEGRWCKRTTESPAIGALTPQSTCDNQYYKELVVPWRQLTLKNGNRLWFEPKIGNNPNDGTKRGPNQPSILLNSDFCFMKKFENIDNKGNINCRTFCRAPRPGQPPHTKPCCPTSNTVPIVKKFAANNALWVKAFTRVFMKMIRVNRYRFRRFLRMKKNKNNKLKNQWNQWKDSEENDIDNMEE